MAPERKTPHLRFDAEIRESGRNPYVEVPKRVSDRLAAYARAGQIPVYGKIRRTAFRTTLVPKKGRRHWLFVNGGMRSAAGVDVGDRVRITLSPVSHLGDAPPPEDLAGALEESDALSAYLSFEPAHRWQLIRFVEDARTPLARRRRLQKAVRQVLGESAPPPRSGGRLASRELWTCPKCGHAFVNKNQWHSCKRFTLDDVFAGKPEEIRALFDRFRRMVEACGPVTMIPYRDRVGFMVRVRFAGATPRMRWLDVGFWLTDRLPSSRFLKVETIDPRAHVHILRISEPKQLDDEVARWLRAAYDVGCQRHLAT